MTSGSGEKLELFDWIWALEGAERDQQDLKTDIEVAEYGIAINLAKDTGAWRSSTLLGPTPRLLNETCSQLNNAKGIRH